MIGFSCVRPWAFYGLFLLIPAVLVCRLHFIKLIKVMGASQSSVFSRLRRSVICRTVCWSCAWCFAVTAFSGITWGTELVPVRRIGASTAFVFDVSWSMTARDVFDRAASKSVSRLDAVKIYAEALLDRMDGSDVSAVIAKGDGIVAVPLTSDTHAVRSLLPALSPALITSAGSSIGSGIDAAVNSFPAQSASARTIVVFTDGEETDGKMGSAAADALKFGIPVVFIGFGAEKESDVLAGDGKTMVKTAQRSGALKKIVSSAKAAYGTAALFPDMQAAQVSYVNSESAGSALEVLDIIKKNAGSADSSGFSYESHPIERFPLFCILAIVFFIAGYFGAEFDPAHLRKNGAASGRSPAVMTGLLILLVLLLPGCSADLQNSIDVLESTFHWYRKDYRKAVAGFMNITENAALQDDEALEQYGLYGLAATYIMQGEMDAALERLRDLSPDAPDFIRFSAAYNIGVIAHRQGNYLQAANAFRQALLIDNTDINAKINLELSLRQRENSSDAGSVEMTPVSEQPRDSALENTVFSIIRENDQNRWKNQQSTDVSDSASDY